MTTINDANWAFLAEQTGMSAPFNDMYFHYLRSLGYVGTLQDMIAASGFGMNPSGLKNPITNAGVGGPYSAPTGFRWSYATILSNPTTVNNNRTIILQRITT